MKNRLLLLWASLLLYAAGAQAQSCELYGQVIDPLGEPLIGATIQLDYLESGLFAAGQVADTDGKYHFKSITPGSYRVTVKYLTYSTVVTYVTLNAGQRLEKSIIMKELEPIIGPPLIYVWFPRHTSTFLTEATLFKAPAVYDDPGRAIAQQAGVLSTNDQANHLSVRGNNPSGVKWFLEDLEIPNPNHTPNAGTSSDRTTQAGGGVNMLKPKFLRSVEFMKGGFRPGIGNAIGGAINAYVQQEPLEAAETSARIGLIGMEAYLRRSPDPKRGDFLDLNARYSTVGLLTDVLGLDFGGERINYYDVNATYSRPVGVQGRLSLFHVSGRSTNRYTAPRDSTAWEESRDRFDIDFGATMALTGLSYRYQRGNHLAKFSMGHAYSRSTRTGAVLRPDLLATDLVQADTVQEHRLSLYGFYQHQNISAHLRVQQQWHAVSRSDVWAAFASSGRLQGLLVQPAVQYSLYSQRYSSLHLGLHAMWWTANGSHSIEPRLRWIKRIHRLGGDLNLTYGLHSQQQAASTYLTQGLGGEYLNRNLGFTRAHHLNIDFERSHESANQGDHRLDYKVSAYFQYLFDVPIALGMGRSYSVLNDLTPLIGAPLANDGTGRNYGLELTLAKQTRQGWELSANGTWYRSEYSGADGLWRNTRYNGQWMTNLSIGRTWASPERLHKRTLKTHKAHRGFYLRAWAAGGLWQSPIDVAASAATGVTTFVESAAYTLRDEASYRADLRLFWEREVFRSEGRGLARLVRKHSVALDIQNLTNRRNVAFTYYDPLQQAIVTKRQLGLIPLLSWTVTW